MACDVHAEMDGYLQMRSGQIHLDQELPLMPASLPVGARIEVSPALAEELISGALRPPVYDNRDFYAQAVQQQVHAQIRDSCPDGFEWLVTEISERLARWPYCAVVAGLNFDEGNKLFVAINRAFGELVALPYKKPRAQLVHYVQPATDIPSPRGGYESERLHTDTSDWDAPAEVISMLCVRADPHGGGRSRVLDLDSIRAEVKSHLGIEALRLLESEQVPWQLAAYCGGGLKWRTVIDNSGMCWRRYTIDLALESGQVRLSRDTLALLDSFEQVISNTTRTHEFLLAQGELLFSDNLRTIHARTRITGAAASQRLMIRSWIRTC